MGDLNQFQVNKVARVKCQKSLLYFTRYFFKKMNQKRFIVNHHHEVIVDAMERVISGDCKRLIINMPPRYGKTELAVKMFIGHCLANNARAKFIHLSYADSLALDNSEEIKDMLQSTEFRTLFPGVEIKRDSKAKNKWYTSEGGGVLARAAGGQVTGFGAGKVEDDDGFEDLFEQKAEFGGAIIIDDPIKPDDADSATIRNKINNRFDSTIRSRVNSRHTPIIVIMQRLHPDDLSGYLIGIEPDVWEVISLPAIQEDGMALWPHKHEIEELNKLRKVNELVFDRQYMQDPRPKEGLVFHESMLNFYDGRTFEMEDDEGNSLVDAITAFVDTADTGEDDLCMPTGINVGPKIFIHSVVFTKEAVEINVELVANDINKFKPEYVRIESNMGGGMYVNLLKNKITAETQLLSIRAKANKHTRILTLSGFIKEFCYFREDDERGEEYGKFMAGLTSYQKSGGNIHDDAPDGLTGLCAMIKRFFSHLYEDIYSEQEDGYGDE